MMSGPLTLHRHPNIDIADLSKPLKPAVRWRRSRSDPTGPYVRTRHATIRWTKHAGGGRNIEVDVYAAERGEIVKDDSWEVGLLKYLCSSNVRNPSAISSEINFVLYTKK